MMGERRTKRLHQAENPVIGWLADTFDSVKAFITDPYLLDRLLTPANRLIEHSDMVSDRCSAAAAQKAAAREQARLQRQQEAARKKQLRKQRLDRIFNAKTFKTAASVFTVAVAAVLFGAALRYGLSDLVKAADEAVSGTDTYAAVSSGDYVSLEKEYEAVEDTQAVLYAESSKDDSNQNDAKQGKPSSSHTPTTLGSTVQTVQPEQEEPLPPVYISDKGRILTPDDYGHATKRFAGCDHILMIDVSSNQAKIDWSAVAASGIEAAMIRVGYRGRNSGKVFEDDCYQYNIKEARNAGLPIGVYFYSQAITVEEAKEEAKFLLDRIGKYEITLPVAIDYEYESMSVYGELSGRLYEAKLSPDAATNVVLAFCRDVAAKGYMPMVYANKDMLSNSLKSDSITAKYKVWLACYSNRALYGDEYSYWQFTDKGHVDGIKGNVCLDFWYKAKE